MTEAPQMRDASATTADASFAEIAQRRRGRIRRYFYKRPRAMDAVVILCYVLLALPTIITSAIDGKWFVVAILLMIAAALFFRRQFPLQVVLAVALLEISATILNPWGSNVSAGLWFALYAVASLRKRALTLMVFAAASLPLSLLYLFMWTSPSQMDTLQDVPENFHLINNIATSVTIMLSNLLATGIGISVRQRREHEAEIAAWAARTTQLGKVTERNRIAREMHDVVAHSLTVMISLSDGAAVVVRKDPQRAGDVLGELSRTGRAALADMRRVLGVLRDDSGRPAPLTPLESGQNLAKLLDGFRTAGLPLHYAHTGPGLPADPAFELTVYRIVQESLTNVLRYGRSLSRVDVQVARDGDLVTIDVYDDGRGTREGGSEPVGSLGTGQGIAGMNERAGIYAGIVTAGPAKRGGWAVHAELRWNGEKGES
ncbi:histidine kinase [Paenarthrobacter aurescens]|uniref:histidine kinase n=1 Tax=Paenarthrobacter aurescens TaxID=43663 RepID=A0A4Y3NI01_PAEAU|nr:histidine kinase [Paenarthrobacter aurescens]UKA49940.1 histidine kinase [Arthrobacter sp. FW305-123]MDO6141664.1 histidine kinase [Paenarthrobacter aurescens]MDO6149427.1 histidine kinase [Paenarthrobacter aurescens]MDO6156713.1 histidine kinase [Paenarthrobacter aurescens]MDO6160699.1 histidine kinase [Paenarthrobacter aurescens]